MKRWNDIATAQRHVPQIVPLVSITGPAAVPGDGKVRFQVPIVDARLRVKISLPFVMADGAAQYPDLTGFATLWLNETDNDLSGIWGRAIPLTNIEGTRAAPTAIPASPGLLGYSREFVTSADYIEGELTILSNLTLGTWILQTRYQPEAGQRFTPEEWEEIRSLCIPIATTPKIVINI